MVFLRGHVLPLLNFWDETAPHFLFATKNAHLNRSKRNRFCQIERAFFVRDFYVFHIATDPESKGKKACHANSTLEITLFPSLFLIYLSIINELFFSMFCNARHRDIIYMLLANFGFYEQNA